MRKLQPFFSIIIPTLNEEEYLPLLLKDLSKQTFKKFETIVVDASSQDKSPKITKRFQKTKLVNSKKANVGYQRNLGAKSAKGKYLLFIDADTRIPKYFLEGIKYRISVKKPHIFTCWMKSDSQKPADKTITTSMNVALETGRFLESPVAYGTMIGCRKNAFLKIGGFDPKITFAEDTEFVKRAVKKGFSFEIFKDPRFAFSLRRFRTEGTLPLLQKYAKLNLRVILNEFPKKRLKDYPMLGGSYYKDKKKPNLITSLEKTLKKIRKPRGKKRLRKFLENLFLE